MFEPNVLSQFPRVTYFFLAALGACFGSFAGVVIGRVQEGLSIVAPRSYCDTCKNQLKAWHNIPLISWLILRGRCGFCQTKIGFRPLIIELIFMFSMLAIVANYGFSIASVERFVFVFFLVCMAYIDLDTFYLPHSLLFGFIFLGFLTLGIYYLYPGAYVGQDISLPILQTLVINPTPYFSLSNKLWGAFVGAGFFSAINLVSTFILRRTGRLTKDQWSMGWGDPILLFGIGLFVGMSHIILVIFLASIFGSIMGLALKFFGQQKTGEEDIADGALPFGPFLALAAIIVHMI